MDVGVCGVLESGHYRRFFCNSLLIESGLIATQRTSRTFGKLMESRCFRYLALQLYSEQDTGKRFFSRFQVDHTSAIPFSVVR